MELFDEKACLERLAAANERYKMVNRKRYRDVAIAFSVWGVMLVGTLICVL